MRDAADNPCPLSPPVHAREGSLIIIPREGDQLVRFYTELPGTAAAADLRLEDLQERVRLILRPYAFAVAGTAWWSAYAVGQRCAERFTQSGRVFLTGDACHTHSPKAGQGMNVSLQDGYNLGWKLAAVLRGRAAPALLDTYVGEREKTARDLIAFDRHLTNLFSTAYRREHGVTPADFRDYFIKAGRYTAGQAYRYEASLIVSSYRAPGLATAVHVGMRFPSAQVVRFCDARAMALVKGLPADGRWHVVVFAGDISERKAAARLRKVGHPPSHTRLARRKILTPASAPTASKNLSPTGHLPVPIRTASFTWYSSWRASAPRSSSRR